MSRSKLEELAAVVAFDEDSAMFVCISIINSFIVPSVTGKDSSILIPLKPENPFARCL